MGGSIAVVIRKENGSVMPMHRWTNELPYVINNINIPLLGDESVRDYINTWTKWKDDWEKNKETGKYEFAMTDTYSPYPSAIAPHGYGIVVLDFQEKYILHAQGYSGIGTIYLTAAELERREVGPEFENEENRWNMLNRFCREGRLKGVQFDDNSFVSSIDLRINTTEDLQNFHTEQYNLHMEMTRDRDTIKAHHTLRGERWPRRNAARDYVLDMSPFTVIRYEENDNGFLALKRKMSRLGFIFTANDENEWDEFLK